MSNPDELPENSQIANGEASIDITFEEENPKRALKKLRSIIKEYDDYLTVPNRRKNDILFRRFVVKHINKSNDVLKEVHAMLIEKQQMSTWAVGERLINEIGSFAKDIDKGDYGFTTFFDNPKILDLDISQLYLVDLELIRVLEAIDERINAFMRLVRRNYLEDVDLWFESLDRIMGRIIQLNDDRVKLIGSYERIS